MLFLKYNLIYILETSNIVHIIDTQFTQFHITVLKEIQKELTILLEKYIVYSIANIFLRIVAQTYSS